MVQPLLDRHGTGGQPGSVQAGAGAGAVSMVVVVVVVMMVMVMAMAVLEQGGGGVRVEEEVGVERLAAARAHEEAADEQHARHAERPQALDLAEAHGELRRRRAQAPRHGRQRQDVRRQVRQAVPGVRHHGLRVEGVAARALDDGHAQVGVEADARDAHARVVLVLGREVDVVMMMMVVVVVVMVVRVAGVASFLHLRLRPCAHDAAVAATAAAGDEWRYGRKQ